jgi:NADH-quinone oxidoreductase subunit H
VIAIVPAVDPMLDGDVWGSALAVVAVKVLVVFGVGVLATALMIWFERKVVAGMHNRIGPNKAGPFGVLQTLADGVKLFFKEDLIPDRADRFVFRLAPFLALVPAFLAFAIIPLGGDFRDGKEGFVTILGHETRLQLADPPMGVLFALAISGIAVYGIMLAGWSSGSKYPLLGSVRASAQMISYEAALGLSLAAVVLVSGTLSTSGIVAGQGSLGDWNVAATGVIPFVIFLIAATAELNRPPFDLVEAEQELVGGFHTEYSSIRFALFYLAEFMNVIAMSALMVTLFFGGPQPPSVGDTTLDIPFLPNALEGTVWLLAKVLVFLYAYVWFRATLPRLRYDQLMDLGWKVLIPASLGWLMLLAAQRIADDAGWDRVLVTIIAAIVLLAAWILLLLAQHVGAERRRNEGAAF